MNLTPHRYALIVAYLRFWVWYQYATDSKRKCLEMGGNVPSPTKPHMCINSKNAWYPDWYTLYVCFDSAQDHSHCRLSSIVCNLEACKESTATSAQTLLGKLSAIGLFLVLNSRIGRSSTICCSFQPVLHDWCNKGRGMCYPVCGMVHIKEPLLLLDKSSLCGGSGFPFLLSEWSLTIIMSGTI